MRKIMTTPRRTSRSSLLAVLLLIGGVVLCACPQMAEWRDSQIETSHRLAEGDRVEPPATPISVPRKVSQVLPLDASFVVLEFTAVRMQTDVHLTALSSWDVEQTVLWMLGELGRLGYTTDDNPSRILDGVEYAGQGDSFTMLRVQVTSNGAGQCIVSLEGRNR
jgi:hypothetical protein